MLYKGRFEGKLRVKRELTLHFYIFFVLFLYFYALFNVYVARVAS